MKVINIYGGPGSGKSTTAAGVFHLMKLKGVNCELVTEYAKDKVWEGSTAVLKNQLYVFAKQEHRLWRCKESKVDVCVTDGPILLGLGYQKYYKGSGLTKIQAYSSYCCYDNVDIYLKRTKEYKDLGRNETAEQAKQLDEFLYEVIGEFVEFQHVDGDEKAPQRILEIGGLR